MASASQQNQNESPEYLAFQDQYSNLYEQMQDPLQLAVHLFSAGIISGTTKTNILSSAKENEKIARLLDAVERQIKSDPSAFHKFAEKLGKERYAVHLCDKLKTSLAQVKRHVQLTSLPVLASSPTTVQSPIASYSEFLKHCYRNELPDDDKLITTASKRFIQLAIINKESVSRRESDEIVVTCLHGDMDGIIKERTPLLLGDILKCDEGQNMRCVLVEGAPGVGKSTLAWELCHNWDKLATIKPFELVVLVRLREKRAQEASSIEDLFPHDSNTDMSNLVAIVQQRRGRGVLLICDGFDEIPDSNNGITYPTLGSLYIDLIKGKYLQEATLIITSRPSITAKLMERCQHDIHKRVEVLGFTKDKIKAFCESIFFGLMLDNFVSYIESNPPIHDLMYIPLNANIIALAYEESYSTHHPFPKTMTQLYTVLVQVLIRRHLIHTKQIPSNSRINLLVPTMENINKLPGNTGSQLVQLAKTAYEGLLREKYVFTDLGDEFVHLGMMKKTTSLGVSVGNVCSYSFLHLTLQEYLATLNIALVPPHVCMLLLTPKEVMRFNMKLLFRSHLVEAKLHSHFTSFCNFLHFEKDIIPDGLDIIFDRKDVFIRFLAGLCPLISKNYVYRRLLLSLRRYYHHITKLHCIPLTVVKCAYEYPNIIRDLEAVQEVLKGKIVCIREFSMVAFDYFTLGYFICNFGGRWKVTIAKQEEVNFLVNGFQSSHRFSGQIQSLEIYDCSDLSKLTPLLKCLRELSLVRYSPSANDVTLFKQLISPKSYLTKLVLKACDEKIEPLLPVLFQPSSLKCVEISVSSITMMARIGDSSCLTNIEKFCLRLI